MTHDDPDLSPVHGVSLADFVAVSLGLGTVQYDSTRSAEVAGRRGIDPRAWERAAPVWSDRLRSSPSVAAEFARIYRLG